jgi:hypothetical protein
MDDDLLRNKLFPLLKGAVNYYLYFLKEEADGKLHLPATFSPEYGSAEDCHYDLALLRWGCQTLVKAADRLHIDDPLLPKWKHVLANLTPYPQDENGLRIGRDVPYANSHRHYSHLLAAYPLYLLNREDAADSALIKQSLDYWQSKAGAHQGYSLTGASSISSALGNGNDALNYLNGLFGRASTHCTANPVPLSKRRFRARNPSTTCCCKVGATRYVSSPLCRMPGRTWLTMTSGPKVPLPFLPAAGQGRRLSSKSRAGQENHAYW